MAGRESPRREDPGRRREPGSAPVVGRAEDLIHPMREEDLPAVLAIERNSFPTPWSERTFRGLLGRQNAVLLVAKDPEAGVLGYAALWITGPEAELGDLAVRPDARRRGVGRALLRASLAEAARRRVHDVFLEVRASNLPARRLYEAAGFERTAVRPGYYRRPREDALVLRRPAETSAADDDREARGGARPR